MRIMILPSSPSVGLFFHFKVQRSYRMKQWLAGGLQKILLGLRHQTD